MVPTAETISQVQSQPGLSNKTSSPKPKAEQPSLHPQTHCAQGKKPDAKGHIECDPTGRNRPEQANPETEIGLVVARAAGGPRKGCKQAERAVSLLKQLDCALVMGGSKV